MTRYGRVRTHVRKIDSRTTTILLALAVLVATLTTLVSPVQAQIFQVLHNFTGGLDGGNPTSGVTLDPAGNLYGTNTFGAAGYGAVYQLKHPRSGWILNSLYSFSGGSDGAIPLARVVFGPSGALYGTTLSGGNLNCSDNAPNGCGTVFSLKPKPTFCLTTSCPWKETVLYSFNGGTDGAGPQFAELLFDQAGSVYGTTTFGGSSGSGTVYKLTPSGTQSVLYSFSDGSDGALPWNGVIFDPAGNLYGTTAYGGDRTECRAGCGTAFELSPRGAGWTESVLHSFELQSDGASLFAGLISDRSGNFYGGTWAGGPGGAGTVFELTHSNGSWTVNTIYSFTGIQGTIFANLSMDGAGNLYGTTVYGGANGFGNVFKLTPVGNGNWTYTSLHDFSGSGDGGYPESNVGIDASGNLYGTTYAGGTTGPSCDSSVDNQCGVVWQITP